MANSHPDKCSGVVPFEDAADRAAHNLISTGLARLCCGLVAAFQGNSKRAQIEATGAIALVRVHDGLVKAQSSENPPPMHELPRFVIGYLANLASALDQPGNVEKVREWASDMDEVAELERLLWEEADG